MPPVTIVRRHLLFMTRASSIILTLALVFGAALPARAFEVVVEFAQFKTDSTVSRLEVHYAIPDTSVKYRLVPDGYLSEVFVSILLTNALGDTVRQEWIVSTSFPTYPKEHQRHRCVQQPVHRVETRR